MLLRVGQQSTRAFQGEGAWDSGSSHQPLDWVSQLQRPYKECLHLDPHKLCAMAALSCFTKEGHDRFLPPSTLHLTGAMHL